MSMTISNWLLWIIFINIISAQNKLVRPRKGVAANVAASASSKTQRVPYSPQIITSNRVTSSSQYEEPPVTITDSHMWTRNSYTAEEKLVAQLLNRGSLTVRPNGYQNQSTNPVHVAITYNVVQILGFSQAEETLSISGWFTLRWEDPRLTWNPNEFSDIQEVSLPSTNLWIPDVGVMNGKASTDFDFSAGVRGRVSVSSGGTIIWLHGAVLDVTCPLDVSFFPFDYQTCFLILTPWQSGEKQLLLEPFTHGSAVDNSYLPNSNVSEWEIQSVHFLSKKYRSDLNITYQYVSIAIHLKRQPLYFVVLVLVPFSMLSALACLIFTLDDTGDRLSVALSLVLSMTMYVVIVSTNAPRSMRTLPVLGIFLLDQLGLLSIATILAVMNNKLYQANELITWQDLIYTISGTGQNKKCTNDTFKNSSLFEEHFHEINSNQHVANYYKDQMFRKSNIGTKIANADYLKNYLNSPKMDLIYCNDNENNIKIDDNKRFVRGHLKNDITKYEKSDLYTKINTPHSDGKYRWSDFDSDNSIKNIDHHNRSVDLVNENLQQQTISNFHKRTNNKTVQSKINKFDKRTTQSKINDLSRTRPSSNCPNKSPWVEHLPILYNQISYDDPLKQSDLNNSSESINNSSENSPNKFFRTTITATAAAAIAATKALASQSNKRKQHKYNSNRITESHKALNSRNAKNFNLYKISQDDDELTHSQFTAQQAVNAAFEAALITYEMSNKNYIKNSHYKHYKTKHKFPRNQKSIYMDLENKKHSNEFKHFPYRKLASRLDCIQMIAYLFLSTINAIVCLILMPRYFQDSNPPENLIS